MSSLSIPIELDLFPEEIKTRQDYSATFAGNMTLPIHKWYRYTAGFSASWVHQLIKKEKQSKVLRIIDPFAGSGTVLLESEFENVESIGIEAHPYIFRIANTKLAWDFPADEFRNQTLQFLTQAKRHTTSRIDFPKLIMNCYPIEILNKLEALKETWFSFNQSDIIKDFNWFIITSILRITSPVGTAQWQYIQPTKTKAKIIDPFIAFESKVLEMYLDMKRLQFKNSKISKALIFNEDARKIKSIPEGWGNLVITSPPYANNYDYADATRLEMTFWGDITGWSDLQDSVRKNLVRACTQHVSKFGSEVNGILADPKLKVIEGELRGVYENLKNERLGHGGKKNYHLMIAAYFSDLADVFISLRKATSKGSMMCFVIGDSAPYGVYVPVDRWLGELAVSAGFESYTFERLRDRNVKWKNRKHTVPLKEGRLWING
jgi:site-specific DNA-adenine methylase